MTKLTYMFLTFISMVTCVVAFELAMGWAHFDGINPVAMITTMVGIAIVARLILIQDLLTKINDKQK